MERARDIDRSLVGLWITLPLLLARAVGDRRRSVERVARHVEAPTTEWRRVRLSTNVGPAVVGLRSMDVVLPEWILSLDEPLRALVLRHEEEHRTARDPYLLFGAAIAVGAHAVESGALVSGAPASPGDRAGLRRARAPRASVAGAIRHADAHDRATTLHRADTVRADAVGTNHQLERRILAMRTTTRKLARTTMYGGGIIAVALLAFASSLQSAGATFKNRTSSPPSHALRPSPLPRSGPRRFRSRSRAPTAWRQKERSPQAGAGADHPHAATRQRGAALPGNARVGRRRGRDTRAVQHRRRGKAIPSTALMLMSTHDLFSESVRTALQTWRGPANTTVQVPYVFVMADQTAKDLKGMEKGLPPGAVVVIGARPANATGPVGIVMSPANSDGSPTGPIPVSENQTFFDFQVESESAPMPGNHAPRYPDILRSANVEGEVVAQFIVGTDGLADTATFKVLRSTHELLHPDGQGRASPSMRFYPAKSAGAQ